MFETNRLEPESHARVCNSIVVAMVRVDEYTKNIS